MSDTQTPVPPSYLDGLVNVILTGPGASLVSSHVITEPMLNAAVGALVALFNVVYMAVTLNPSRQSPIQALMGLVAKARAGARWNGYVKAAEAQVAARAAAFAREEVRKAAGPVAGPILAPLAAKAAQDAVASAAKSFLYPQT